MKKTTIDIPIYQCKLTIILDKDLLENSEYTIDVGQLYKKTYNDISSKSNIEIDENVFIPEI